jgi:hypothetical protein
MYFLQAKFSGFVHSVEGTTTAPHYPIQFQELVILCYNLQLPFSMETTHCHFSTSKLNQLELDT